MLIREKYVSLHPLKRNNGRVAQLNRVADYGSAGYRFESCRDHRGPLQGICRGFLFFFAQKLRVSLKTWGNSHLHLHSKGFFPEIEVQDFPIRGKAVYLRVKCRRWEDPETGQYLRLL